MKTLLHVWVVLVASPTPVLRFILIVMATDQIPLKATVLDLFGFGLKTSPLNIHEMILFYKIKDKFVKSQPQVTLFGFYKSHDKVDFFLRRTSSRDLTQLMFSSSPSIWSNMTVRQVVRVKIPNLTHFYGCEIFHNRTVKCVTLDILTLTPRVTIIPSLHGLSSTIFQPKPVCLPRK